MVTIRGHLMRIQEMRECRPSPKLTSAPPPPHAEEFPWSIVKLCGKFVGMGRSEGTTLPLLSSHVILPDTTSLPLTSSASSFSSWIQERNAPHPLRFWLRKLTPSGTKVPKKWSIQNLSKSEEHLSIQSLGQVISKLSSPQKHIRSRLGSQTNPS